MDFKSQYVQVLREKDPKLFMELRRNGHLDAFLQEKSQEAHKMLDDLLAPEPKGSDGFPKDLQAYRLAEERVRAEMFDFPVLEKDQHLEPPDDLMQGFKCPKIKGGVIEQQMKLRISRQRLAILLRLSQDLNLPPEKRRAASALAQSQQAAVILGKNCATPGDHSSSKPGKIGKVMRWVAANS